MKVRLTRKLAEEIDGIDLRGYEVGDMIDLTPDEARLIVAEDWAHPDRRVLATPVTHSRRATDRGTAQRSRYPGEEDRAIAADQLRRPK